MTDAIEHAQFVLLGESHFSQETPKLAAAVCRAMHPDSYAVEAGPSAAAYVDGLLTSPDRKSQMQKRARAHPANMAFLDDEQANDLAASCPAVLRRKAHEVHRSHQVQQEIRGSVAQWRDLRFARRATNSTASPACCQRANVWCMVNARALTF
jgi:hypothetical protein